MARYPARRLRRTVEATGYTRSRTSRRASPSSRRTEELNAVTARLTDEGVYTGPTRFRMTAVPLREQISGSLRPALLVLLGAVALVLVIACANVAGLLFVRGERRRRETALRAVLGAGRTRLARQFLTEGVVIAIVGGVLGMLIAWLGVVATRAWAPRSLGLVSDVSLNGGVLAFALVTTLGTVCSSRSHRHSPRRA